MVGTLKKAKNNFLNYFSWSLVHGLVTKTTEKCEMTCSRIFWKDYCCATVKMAHVLDNGENFVQKEVQCLDRSIAGPDVAFTFEKKVGFTVICNKA